MLQHLFNMSRFVIGALENVPLEGGGTTDTTTDTATSTTTSGGYETATWWTHVVEPILDLLNSLLVPILIILGTAGSIYVIILGVQYAKAETSDKREEAKKRMIHAVVGIVVMLVLLILLYLFTNNVGGILDDFKDLVATESNEKKKTPIRTTKKY